MDADLAVAAARAALDDIKQILSSVREVKVWAIESLTMYGEVGLTPPPSLLVGSQCASSLDYFLDEATGEAETLLLNLIALNEGGSSDSNGNAD